MAISSLILIDIDYSSKETVSNKCYTHSIKIKYRDPPTWYNLYDPNIEESGDSSKRLDIKLNKSTKTD